MPNGAKVTLNVHDSPAATELHVLPLTENSPALLLLIEATFTGSVPTLLIITSCGALALPSS